MPIVVRDMRLQVRVKAEVWQLLGGLLNGLASATHCNLNEKGKM